MIIGGLRVGLGLGDGVGTLKYLVAQEPDALQQVVSGKGDSNVLGLQLVLHILKGGRDGRIERLEVHLVVAGDGARLGVALLEDALDMRSPAARGFVEFWIREVSIRD